MNRNKKKITVAVLAGAAAAFTGASAHAALSLTYTRTNETFSNGNYDVIDVLLTGMTLGAGSGATSVQLSSSSSAAAGGLGDNTSGPITGDAGTSPADPEILGLSGTFTVAGSGNTIGTPGFSGTTGAHTYKNYITNGAAGGGDPQYTGSPSGYGSSFASLPSLQSQSLTGDTGSSATGSTAITGNSTALTGTWYVTPAFTGAAGTTNNQGGIEPGADASGFGEPNGLLAEILVTKNAGFSYSGSYSDYGLGANAQSLAFSVPAVGAITTSGPTTHNIVSLTSATQTGGNYGVQLASGTGNNQATFNPGTNAPLITVVSHGSGAYTPGAANNVNGGTGDATDFTGVTGFLSGDQEVYALKLKVGGATPTTTQVNQIVTDISGQSGDGVSTVASLLSPSGNLATSVAAIFPGYDLMLTVASGSTTPFLGFDFSQETNVAGVTVTDIGAIPEPASAAMLLIGSSGLLMGRRKRALLKA